MKTGFFQALLGCCSGTDIFDKLKDQTLLRSLLHLLLMAVISSVIMSLGIYPALRNSVMGSLNAIADNCGTLICTSNAVLPEKEPEKMRNFLVAGPMSVVYLPENAASLPDGFKRDCHIGVIWSGGRIGFWIEEKSDVYNFMTLDESLSGVRSQSVNGKNGLIAALKKSPAMQFNIAEGKVERFTPENLRAFARAVLPLGVGVMLLRQTVLEVMLYIGMFTLVSVLMNLGRPRRLKVREMIVLAIYAGFPAMLIGALAEALQLPVLSFNVVYVFGMSIYLIIVMNRLERKRQEREWQQLQQ